MANTLRPGSVALLLILAACTETEDGEDDSFVADGKDDQGGVVEGSAQALAVLRVVNEADAAELQDANLTSTSATNILAHRAGADGMLDTADDDPFETLVELDAVKYVGPVVFRKLLAYATAKGYLVFAWRTVLDHVSLVDYDNPNLCQVQAPSDANAVRLLFDERENGYWHIEVRTALSQLIQQIMPAFSGWSEPVPGTAARYFAEQQPGAYLHCIGIARAAAFEVPVATNDPLRCSSAPARPSWSGDVGGSGAVQLVPNPSLYGSFSSGLASRCGSVPIAVAYTAPTDGTYTFRAVTGGYLSLRSGCDAVELGCGSTATQNLVAGQTIVVGFGGAYDVGNWIDVKRAPRDANCSDQFDDDGDGLIDCADPDCAAACRVHELCDDAVDNDGDGNFDCEDTECWTAAVCSSNTCPGVALGNLAVVDEWGNASQAPYEGFLSCASTAPDWVGSRFYQWTAPTSATYEFRIRAYGSIGNYGVRVMEGTCEGDVLGCFTFSTAGNSSMRVTLTGGQPVVIEVGLSRNSAQNLYSGFELTVQQQ